MVKHIVMFKLSETWDLVLTAELDSLNKAGRACVDYEVWN